MTLGVPSRTSEGVSRQPRLPVRKSEKGSRKAVPRFRFAPAFFSFSWLTASKARDQGLLAWCEQALTPCSLIAINVPEKLHTLSTGCAEAIGYRGASRSVSSPETAVGYCLSRHRYFASHPVICHAQQPHQRVLWLRAARAAAPP